ncbi:Uncharacterized protein TCM_020888 [Theobroma cacao]|uniref:Chromatin modification-related protein MEAF6 n=1 Tax=Theobroma cacao TaxID=3641 RepID=A0A061EUT1_THECC|nr:Uncharacterized protein TCM_020888 [Theobroma cacao]
MSLGQRGSANPAAMLASLMTKRDKLQDDLRNIEKQVYELETNYLQDSSHFGHVLKGFEGFLSSSKNTANLKRYRKFQPEDRLFSLSSVTSPAIEVTLDVFSARWVIRRTCGLFIIANMHAERGLLYFCFYPILGIYDHILNESIALKLTEFNVSSGDAHLQAEELGVRQDDGRSDFGPGRSKGGGLAANGQGKPKKGRTASAARDGKRIRPSSEPDFDDEDDPDMGLR